MARRPRIHYPGALYHVIARGNKGQKVFRQDQDYRLHLQLLKDYKHPYKFLLHVYVLMPTNLHLLIEIGVAEYFHRDPVAISRGIGKVGVRMGVDKHFQAKLRELKEVVMLREATNKKLVMPNPKPFSSLFGIISKQVR